MRFTSRAMQRRKSPRGESSSDAAPIPELPRWEATLTPSIAELGAAVEDVRRNATSLRIRILQAVGDGSASWPDTAAKLAVRQTIWIHVQCAITSFSRGSLSGWMTPAWRVAA